MRALSDFDLVDVLERGRACSPAQRAILLLRIAAPDVEAGAVHAKSVGQRDAALLALRRATFGPTFVTVLACDECNGRIEATFEVDLPEASSSAPGESVLRVEDYEVLYHVPTAGDLAAIDAGLDPDAARLRLLDRVVRAARDGTVVPSDELPVSVAEAVGDAIRAADPGSELLLDLACPHCRRTWRAGFDIVSFFWREIETAAGRVLRDVHRLARVYGWSEADLLRMSPWRRRQYLDLIDLA